MAYAKRYVVVNTIAYAITATIVYVIVNAITYEVVYVIVYAILNAIVNVSNKLSNHAINKTR